jgi:hypothetical protein
LTPGVEPPPRRSAVAGVVAATRAGGTRVGFHLYNALDHVALGLDALC